MKRPHNWYAILILTCITITLYAKIPVILDTDIGTDIDDTWALAFLLQSPEIDLKLIVTDTHNTPERTKLVAKFLHTVGRVDIPIGMGIWQDNFTGPSSAALFGWSHDFDMRSYEGKVYENGVDAMIETIHRSDQQVTIVVIAPCPNIEVALQKDPTIASKCRIVAMGGSVRFGYGNSTIISAEANIKDNVTAARYMYDASWDITSAPLDVTNWSQMGGDSYQKVRMSKSIVTRTLMENFVYWFEHCTWANQSGIYQTDPKIRASTLHDLVAASMVLNDASKYLVVETLPIMINDTGYTLISSDKGRDVHEATYWKQNEQWFEWMANVLA